VLEIAGFQGEKDGIALANPVARIEVAMMTDYAEPTEANEHGANVPEPEAIPRTRTLDGFALETGHGIDVRSLAHGMTLLVNTKNNHYRVVILNAAHRTVLVKGGNLFRHDTEARLTGATSGGSTLKSGWIGVGFRMELSVNGRRVITSPVRSITVESVQ
jgi:hypothetical protein